LQAIIDATERGEIPGLVRVVISSKQNAYALQRARQHSIEGLFIDPKRYKTRLGFAKKIVRELKSRKIDLVCLAGFMHILPPYFVRQFRHRIMNIHPALLPAFGGEGMYGHHVHEAVIQAGVKYSGCTVHFVDEGCDTGPIIVQKAIPVRQTDTPEILAKRILKWEHKLYPQAVKLFSEGRLVVKGRKVLENIKESKGIY